MKNYIIYYNLRFLLELAQSESERLKNAQPGERGRLISALGAEQASDKFFITCLIMVEGLVKKSHSKDNVPNLLPVRACKLQYQIMQ